MGFNRNAEPQSIWAAVDDAVIHDLLDRCGCWEVWIIIVPKALVAHTECVTRARAFEGGARNELRLRHAHEVT